MVNWWLGAIEAFEALQANNIRAYLLVVTMPPGFAANRSMEDKLRRLRELLRLG